MPKKAKSSEIVEKKARKQYPDRDTRIAMADEKIERLTKLNEDRRDLIEKTEAKLNERKAALAKSEAMLKKVISRREKLLAAKEAPAGSPAARAQRAAEKAQFDELKARLKAQGKTLDDLMNLL